MPPSQSAFYNGLEDMAISWDEAGREKLADNMERFSRLHGLYEMRLPQCGTGLIRICNG